MSTTSKRIQVVFRKTERDLLKLSSSQQPETVHSFRTSARRLQTLLEALVPERSRKQKRLLKMLDRIRKRAGKAREVDVQLAALRSLKIPQEPRRKTQLTQSLIELRAKHENKLCKILTKQAVREIRKRLNRAGKEVRIGVTTDPLAVAQQLLVNAARPTGPMNEDGLHQYRIAVKRARYAAEFAPASPESKKFVAELKRIQDAIGTWHDWFTLTNTAASRLGDVGQSSTVAALRNLTAGKFRHALAALSTSPAMAGLPQAKPRSTEHSLRLEASAPRTVEQTESAA